MKNDKYTMSGLTGMMLLLLMIMLLLIIGIISGVVEVPNTGDINIFPPADSDNDGVPDDDEEEWGTDPADPEDYPGDPDEAWGLDDECRYVCVIQQGYDNGIANPLWSPGDAFVGCNPATSDVTIVIDNGECCCWNNETATTTPTTLLPTTSVPLTTSTVEGYTYAECDAEKEAAEKAYYDLASSLDNCNDIAWNFCDQVGTGLKWFSFFEPNCCVWDCN